MRVIHGYTKADIPRLQELSDTCFVGAERPPHETFVHMLQTSEVWVARLDVLTEKYSDIKIIGFIIVNQHGPSAYLWSIAVDPVFRGRGVARNLMREAELWVKFHGGTEMRLHVKDDNPSQVLYFKRGYRVEDVVREYYGPETTALKMKKVLC